VILPVYARIRNGGKQDQGVDETLPDGKIWLANWRGG